MASWIAVGRKAKLHTHVRMCTHARARVCVCVEHWGVPENKAHRSAAHVAAWQWGLQAQWAWWVWRPRAGRLGPVSASQPPGKGVSVCVCVWLDGCVHVCLGTTVGWRDLPCGGCPLGGSTCGGDSTRPNGGGKVRVQPWGRHGCPQPRRSRRGAVWCVCVSWGGVNPASVCHGASSRAGVWHLYPGCSCRGPGAVPLSLSPPGGASEDLRGHYSLCPVRPCPQPHPLASNVDLLDL